MRHPRVPRARFAIGTEHEKIPFYRENRAPVPYDGDRGIKALLEGLARETGWEPILDVGHIIGLAAEELVGANVGSQVLVVAPGAEGASATAIVVDILGIVPVPEQ